jgi:exodeoxyribonuclease VII small subunit
MGTKKKTKEETPERFEDVLKGLGQIVEKLEASDLPLEESLRAFEDGVKLSRTGQEILDAAERRVERLLADGTTVPVEDEN